MTQEEFDILKVYGTLTEDEKYIVMRLIQSLLEVRKEKIEDLCKSSMSL